MNIDVSGKAILGRTYAGSMIIAVGYHEFSFPVTVALGMDVKCGTIIGLHLDAAGNGKLGSVAEDEVHIAEDVERFAFHIALYSVVGV